MAAPAAATDEALAARFQRGDMRAFELLVARYHRPIYHFAYRLLGGAEDAEDATQDVFIQVFGALPRARLDVPLRPWLYRIARNRCLDVLKRKRATSFSALADDEDEAGVADVPDSAPLPDELAERADLQRLLTAAIDTLAPAYREVVALRYAGDLGFGEIAMVLGMPENSVKTRFQRAKAVLRVALRDLARET
ncbi:MAG TPA: sigma-70 family RNA polymerase sigma factor [Chloroflexota bacterium]|nr:sigma-70 family RNA polymerase sigma factor [Chloroflexota bacterium]